MGVNIQYINTNHSDVNPKSLKSISKNSQNPVSVVTQQKMQRNFNWAYEVFEYDPNYEERQDKKLNWFFYDWD